MGKYLLRIHDIVVKKATFFKQTTIEEEEEAKSWSLTRWIQRGLFKINLKAYPNPYSYLYRGSQLNMTNYIMRERKRAKKLLTYQMEIYNDFVDSHPSLQLTDKTQRNDQ